MNFLGLVFHVKWFSSRSPHRRIAWYINLCLRKGSITFDTICESPCNCALVRLAYGTVQAQQAGPGLAAPYLVQICSKRAVTCREFPLRRVFSLLGLPGSPGIFVKYQFVNASYHPMLPRGLKMERWQPPDGTSSGKFWIPQMYTVSVKSETPLFWTVNGHSLGFDFLKKELTFFWVRVRSRFSGSARFAASSSSLLVFNFFAWKPPHGKSDLKNSFLRSDFPRRSPLADFLTIPKIREIWAWRAFSATLRTMLRCRQGREIQIR